MRKRFSFFSLHPDLVWCPPSLLSSTHCSLFPRGYSSPRMKVTIHLHLMPSLRNN